ncbi:GNAT family N-acetyltransferase [Streptomyces sp. NPDC059900]|uniref:GNAT family N-acetyltransferase n=1 Tax=Streptomyces sp. NPDC059900 TaxID=3155816 RepID=UPI00342C8BEA
MTYDRSRAQDGEEPGAASGEQNAEAPREQNGAVPRVRHARPADLPRIVELIAEHAAYEKGAPPAPGLDRRLDALLFGEPEPRLRCLVAELPGGEVVGYATCAPEISTWDGTEYLHMDCLFLRDGHRGLGLGERLTDAVAAQARALGLPEVQWQTPAWNEGAIRFYDRIGAEAREKVRFTWPVAQQAPDAVPPRAPGPPLPFDAVFCDLDGVIRFYDMSELEAMERDAGLPHGSTAEIAFAPETDLPLMLGRTGRQEWVAAIARGLADRVPYERGHALGTALAGAGFSADATVVDLLRRARAHLHVALVTNATPWLDDDLAELGIADLAHTVVGSAGVGIVKPDRRIYEIALERAGVRAERCLFVDDRKENVDAAVALGMTGLHYTGPDDLREALAPVLGRD